jgi:nucleoside-diphosphate-sugar epimerase
VKVLVTGGLGLVARWLVRELTDESGGKTPHEVTVFDRRQGRIPGVRTIVGDHESLAAVADAVAGADAVLHLSASHHLTPGVKPADLFRSNLLGVFNAHEAARINGARRVVQWSSVAALGWSGENDDFMPDYLPIDEEHPLRATDAYGLSKAAGEAIAGKFSERHGLETIALRHVWTIVPQEWIELWKHGGKRQGRWIHYAYLDVRDAAAAARRALEIAAPGHTVLYLAADDSCAPAPLAELLPRLRPAIGEKAAGLLGTRSAISNARAKSLLGWQPVHSWRTRPPLTTRLSVSADSLVSGVARRVPRQFRAILATSSRKAAGGR